MHCKRTPIKSSSRLESVRPWYEFETVPDGVRCLGGNQDGVQCQHSEVIQISRAVTDAHPNPAVRLDLWVYGIDLDGNFFFKPQSEIPATIAAHLGFYRPEIDELELLEFVEDNSKRP